MAQCATPVYVCALRVTKLDSTGAPDPGESSIYVTDKTITLGRAVEREDGQRIQRDSGCGTPIIDITDCDRVTGATLTAAFGVLDFELLSLMTGGSLFMSDDETEALGLALPALDASCPDGVGVEAWARAYTGGEQALHPITNKPAYFRFVWPRVTWSYDGEMTLQGTDATDTNLRGVVSSNSQWGTGPAGDLPMFNSVELIYMDDEDDVPTAACEFQELTS